MDSKLESRRKLYRTEDLRIAVAPKLGSADHLPIADLDAVKLHRDPDLEVGDEVLLLDARPGAKRVAVEKVSRMTARPSTSKKAKTEMSCPSCRLISLATSASSTPASTCCFRTSRKLKSGALALRPKSRRRPQPIRNWPPTCAWVATLPAEPPRNGTK